MQNKKHHKSETGGYKLLCLCDEIQESNSRKSAVCTNGWDDRMSRQGCDDIPLWWQFDDSNISSSLDTVNDTLFTQFVKVSLTWKSGGCNLCIKQFPQVSFFMTGIFGRRRRSLKTSSFEYYKDLALASGGQAIQVSKNQLPQATDVILDTSTSALVWLCGSSSAFGATEPCAVHSWTSLKIEHQFVFIAVCSPSGDSSSASKEPWEGDFPFHVGWISAIYHNLHHRKLHYFHADQSCR